MKKKARLIRRSQIIVKSSLIMLCLIMLYGVSLLGGAGRLSYAGSLAERRIPVQNFMTNPEGYNAAMWEIVNLVKESWERELGLTFKKYVRDHDEVLAKGFYGGQFDVMVMYFSGVAARLDPGFMLPLRFYATCPHFYPRIPREKCPEGGGGFNVMGYYNPEFNKLMDKQKTVFDYGERKKIIDKAIEMTVRDRATLVTCAPNMLHLMNTKNWKDEKPMVGEGLQSFWNCIGIKPKGKEKTLKAGSIYATATLNPMAVLSSQDYRNARLIYDSLMRLGSDGKPVNWMIEEIKGLESSKGPNTIIVIRLREDLKFHDGVQVTADDVKFTVDFARKYHSPNLFTYLKDIDRVETEGKFGIRIYLKSPWAGISHVLLSRMLIVPKHIWEKVPEKVSNPIEWANPKPIGSGPFKFESWERAAQMVVTKNKDYFHPVEPERIVKVRFETNEMLAASIERGEIDIQWADPMPATIAMRAQKKKNVKLINAPNMGHMVIELKLDKRPYSDLVFRKALEYCLPRKQIITQIYNGFADSAVSTIPVGNKAWHNPKVFDIASEYNPKKGRQILKNAGYEWDADGNLCYPQ